MHRLACTCALLSFIAAPGALAEMAMPLLPTALAVEIRSQPIAPPSAARQAPAPIESHVAERSRRLGPRRAGAIAEDQ
jgi:hypothetical protein